jgi:hypothetical protein
MGCAVEVIDRPIFLRRPVTDRDWDQMLNFSGAALDTYSATSVKGYENLHGYKMRFETTWLDKP